MTVDKEKIAAIRLQELGSQLQGIMGELNSIINAPEKIKKVSKRDELFARLSNNFDKKQLRRQNK